MLRMVLERNRTEGQGRRGRERRGAERSGLERQKRTGMESNA